MFTKIVILKYICNFLDQLLHPYKFYGRDMPGILFFIFASCEPLNRCKAVPKIRALNLKTLKGRRLAPSRIAFCLVFSLETWTYLLHTL